MRKAIGNKNLDYRAIESDLILSFDTSEFDKTELYMALKNWEKKKGFKLLANCFQDDEK